MLEEISIKSSEIVRCGQTGMFERNSGVAPTITRGHTHPCTSAQIQTHDPHAHTSPAIGVRKEARAPAIRRASVAEAAKALATPTHAATHGTETDDHG